MAINISLYQMSEPENLFPKTIPETPVSTHQIVLKDGCDIDKPTAGTCFIMVYAK